MGNKVTDWFSIKSNQPPHGVEVLGYNSYWEHPDFNPEGVRICFQNDGIWVSAVWNNEMDCYDTKYPSIVPTHWTHLLTKPTTNA